MVNSIEISLEADTGMNGHVFWCTFMSSVWLGQQNCWHVGRDLLIMTVTAHGFSTACPFIGMANLAENSLGHRTSTLVLVYCSSLMTTISHLSTKFSDAVPGLITLPVARRHCCVTLSIKWPTNTRRNLFGAWCGHDCDRLAIEITLAPLQNFSAAIGMIFCSTIKLVFVPQLSISVKWLKSNNHVPVHAWKWRMAPERTRPTRAAPWSSFSSYCNLLFGTGERGIFAKECFKKTCFDISERSS